MCACTGPSFTTVLSALNTEANPGQALSKPWDGRQDRSVASITEIIKTGFLSKSSNVRTLQRGSCFGLVSGFGLVFGKTCQSGESRLGHVTNISAQLLSRPCGVHPPNHCWLVVSINWDKDDKAPPQGCSQKALPKNGLCLSFLPSPLDAETAMTTKELQFQFLSFSLLRQDLTVYIRLIWNSLCRPG